MDKPEILTKFKLVLLVIVVILSGTSLVPFETKKDSIPWSENRKIEWEDFKSGSSLVSGASALTVSAIKSSYSCEGSKSPLTYSIEAVFIPQKSWVNKSDKTELLLRHERLHFDITELHARMFRKQVAERKLYCNQYKDFEKISEQINKQWETCQNLYDKETNHSINEHEQKKWDKKIREELANLEKYALKN